MSHIMQEVESWPVSRLMGSMRNARKHPPKQITQLRKSIREFGFTLPVLAQEDGTLIAGHGRVEAARLEGLTQLPVMIARGWTDEQVRSYRLIDNKIAEGAAWDHELLQVELTELAELGVDLGDYGLAPLNADELDAAKPQLDALKYAVIVRCRDEKHQTELLEALAREGHTVEALIS